MEPPFVVWRSIRARRASGSRSNSCGPRRDHEHDGVVLLELVAREENGHGPSYGGRSALGCGSAVWGVNRGRSPAGRRWRRLECRAAATPGAMVLVRPVYDSDTWVPRWLDFGVLVGDELDIETFDNRPLK